MYGEHKPIANTEVFEEQVGRVVLLDDGESFNITVRRPVTIEERSQKKTPIGTL